MHVIADDKDGNEVVVKLKIPLYDQATVEALQAKVSALEEEIKVLKESKNG
jgi:folate-dependent phosphoribosylglycinamide formyltransferase PurN